MKDPDKENEITKGYVMLGSAIVEQAVIDLREKNCKLYKDAYNFLKNYSGAVEYLCGIKGIDILKMMHMEKRRGAA